MSGEMPLVAVPNFSEGRNVRVIGALEATLSAHARVLNRHYDAQHFDRSWFQHADLMARVANLASKKRRKRYDRVPSQISFRLTSQP